jgi:hypothetical protein
MFVTELADILFVPSVHRCSLYIVMSIVISSVKNLEHSFA